MRIRFVAALCIAVSGSGELLAQRALQRVGSIAQRPQKSQAELAKLRTEKLAKEVFQSAPWVFDYDEARKSAASRNVPLFVYFTRSRAVRPLQRTGEWCTLRQGIQEVRTQGRAIPPQHVEV